MQFTLKQHDEATDGPTLGLDKVEDICGIEIVIWCKKKKLEHSAGEKFQFQTSPVTNLHSLKKTKHCTS